jgi:hypothetical protein
MVCPESYREMMARLLNAPIKVLFPAKIQIALFQIKLSTS